jgi:hypothetical protein
MGTAIRRRARGVAGGVRKIKLHRPAQGVRAWGDGFGGSLRPIRCAVGGVAPGGSARPDVQGNPSMSGSVVQTRPDSPGSCQIPHGQLSASSTAFSQRYSALDRLGRARQLHPQRRAPPTVDNDAPGPAGARGRVLASAGHKAHARVCRPHAAAPYARLRLTLKDEPNAAPQPVRSLR